MKELLYVDCLIRGEASRTKQIADAFFQELDSRQFHVTHLSLNDEPLVPHNRARLEKRDALIASGNMNDDMFRYAKQFAAADLVVVAAPFWDLSIPAILKIYIENISVQDITFGYSATGLVGLCHGTHLVFLTSRGGIYTGSDMEHGSAYMQSLKTFFGFDDYTCIAADGLDIDGFDVDAILRGTCQEAKSLAARLNRA